jgi:iron complex transport system permease protein
MRHRPLSFPLLLVLLAAALACAVVVSTGMGYVQVPLWTVLKILIAKLIGADGALAGLRELYPTVVLEVRLPRILTSAAVGAGLALSGAVFQGILLNPLADPYTLGVSAGAAFGASVVLLFDLGVFGVYTVPVFAFAGAGLTLAAVIYLSASAGGVSSNNLILSGVIVTAILSAGISFLKYMAQERVSVIIFWLLGSFASCTWTDAGLTWGLTAAGFCVFLYFARDLNLLCLGGRTASSLGAEPAKLRLILLITGSLLAAVCVSVSGIIGFVGLLVPHMMRGMAGPDHLRLLPVCLLVGAVLLLGADTVTRAVLPHEVPIGVITALIGGPFFCFIFRKRQMAL